MMRYIRPILALSRAYIARFFRDKTALFFTFLFPLLFLFVFGSLNKTDGDVSFRLALLNHSDSAFAQQFVKQAKKNKAFEIDGSIQAFDVAKEKMSRGEIDSILELPKEFGEPNSQGVPSGTLRVYYQESSPQSGQTIAAVMEKALANINRQLGQPAPLFTVEQKSTASEGLTNFDYVFAGLLGFTILSLGIFGLANQMPAEKKTGVFRRLRASPITAGQLIFANMIYYLLIGLISLALMIVVGLWAFEFNMRGNWVQFTIFATLGIITMFGFGLAIGGWARNENQSAALTNIVAFPLMFLSGVFFPRFLMPEWLQSITAYLPLTPIVDGMRLIMTEGKTLLDLTNELSVMAIWAAIIYIIAIKVFRWE